MFPQKCDVGVPVQEAIIVADKRLIERVILQIYEDLMPSQVDGPARAVGKPGWIILVYAQYTKRS